MTNMISTEEMNWGINQSAPAAGLSGHGEDWGITPAPKDTSIVHVELAHAKTWNKDDYIAVRLSSNVVIYQAKEPHYKTEQLPLQDPWNWA
jgi:hypothetical protein